MYQGPFRRRRQSCGSTMVFTGSGPFIRSGVRHRIHIQPLNYSYDKTRYEVFDTVWSLPTQG